MALERTYTVPLRRGFWKAARWRRTNKAVKTVRAFLAQHMKVTEENVKLGQHLNNHLWRHGGKNPPPRVRLTVRKDDEGIVRAELEGKEFTAVEAPKDAAEQPEGLKEKLQAAMGGEKQD